MKWDEKPLHKVIFDKNAGEDTMSFTSMRFIEASTAYAFSIPYDERWFEIPVKSRTYMVATKLGKEWLHSLQEEYAMQKVRK